MSISGFFQFIIGFILGILLLTLGSVGAAYYFLTQMASTPPKPVFDEEKPKTETVAPKTTTPTSRSKEKTPSAAATKPEPEPVKEEPLPAGSYRAKVSWSSGLSLRSEASTDGDRIGGIGYNAEIIVLSESDDQQWQKIRVVNTGKEGWIKAGNITKIDN